MASTNKTAKAPEANLSHPEPSNPQVEAGWLHQWWHSLGIELQTFFSTALFLSLVLGIFVGLTKIFSETHRVAILEGDGLIVFYPQYLPLRQERELVIRTSKPQSDLKVEIPAELRIQAATPGQGERYAWHIEGAYQVLTFKRLHENSEQVFLLYNLGAQSAFVQQAKIVIGGKEEGKIWIEGALMETARAVGTIALSALLVGGMGSWVWSSLRYHREQRREKLRQQFVDFRAALSQQFPERFEQKMQLFRPYLLTWLRDEGGEALEYINKLYTSAGREANLLEILERIRQEYPRWIPATLSWMAWFIQKQGKEGQDNLGIHSLLFLSWLRRTLPQTPGEQHARIRHLLQKLQPGGVSPTWPPGADAPCALTSPLHTEEKRAKSNAAARLPPNLFPETELDASQAQAQYWLFRTENRLFWDEHPLFRTLTRHIRRTTHPGQTVVQVRGRAGHGRTTLTLAVSRYFPFSEYFGVYLATPEGGQDLREVWAQRLLTFGCCHLIEWLKLSPEVDKVFLHLSASVWPPALLQAKLLRCKNRWLSSTEKSNQKNLIQPMLTLLHTWLHTDLPAMTHAQSLQGAHWWAAFTEFLELTHGLRSWQGVIVAVDWTKPKPPPLEHWQAWLAPAAAYWPVLWVLVTPEETPWLAPTEARYALQWRAEDLMAMLEHRKAVLLDKEAPFYEPFIEQIEAWARQAEGSPRRLAVLYRRWYRQQARQASDRGETHA